MKKSNTVKQTWKRNRSNVRYQMLSGIVMEYDTRYLDQGAVIGHLPSTTLGFSKSGYEGLLVYLVALHPS